MNVFSVVAVIPGPEFGPAITRTYPDNYLQVTPTLWFVAGTGTAQDNSNRLGLTPDFNPAVGQAIVMAVTGYYGRGPNNVWEWIKAKLEAPNVA